MASKTKNINNAGTRIDRSYCEDCACYFDGIKQIQDKISDTEIRKGHGTPHDYLMDKKFNGIKMFPIPGMQYHKYSYGSVYMKIGFTKPCHCQSGKEINLKWVNEYGYRNSIIEIEPKDGKHKPFKNYYEPESINEIENTLVAKMDMNI